MESDTSLEDLCQASARRSRSDEQWHPEDVQAILIIDPATAIDNDRVSDKKEDN
jgi:hypothetical protein